MSIKTLAVQTLLALAVVYQTPVLAGEIQGKILSCTYDTQRLDVTIVNPDGSTSTSSKDIYTSSSGNAKSPRCVGRTPMTIGFVGDLPRDLTAQFTNISGSARDGNVVVCSGRVEAGATSVDINLLNHCVCSFGKPSPASCP